MSRVGAETIPGASRRLLGQVLDLTTMSTSGILAADLVLRGVTIPAGSTFQDAEPFDDRVYSLARATIVHGVQVTAGSTLEVAPFPPPLSSCFSLLLVPLYPWFAWHRYRDVVRPAVFAIEPADPLTVGNVEIHGGDRLWLGRGGLVALMVRSPRILDGHALDGGTVTFGRNGRARELMLHRSQRLCDLPCFGSGLVGTEVLLDDEGRVRRCVLSEDAVLRGKGYARGTRITFDDHGRVIATKVMRIDVALYSPRPAFMNSASSTSASRAP